MIGREELDDDQASMMVITAMHDTIMEDDFTVEDGDDPDLVTDLEIDEVCMSDLVTALEREFEVSVPQEHVEGWETFRDIVRTMMNIHNNDVGDPVDLSDFDEDE